MSARRLSNKQWLTLTALAILLAMALSAGILFAANAPEPPDAAVAPIPPEPVVDRVSLQTDDVQEQVNLPPITKEPPAYPNLDSHLNQLAEDYAGVHQPSDAQQRTTETDAEPVLVTLYVEPERVDDVRQYLEDNGIFVRNVGADYIEAHIPPSMLGAASEQPGVLRVDTVIPPQSHQSRERVISQGVGLHGADAWHNLGYRGSSIKVGVIDSGFEGFSRLQGSELPANVTARCYFDGPKAPTSQLSDCEAGSDHGTAVAETVIDVAPEAELYIAKVHSFGDLRNAADWMADQGVKVINVSLGFAYDGPGDGTSPSSNSPLKTIETAVANDITWINAGGNDARRVWYGQFFDPNDTGFHHFRSDDVGNAFRVLEGDAPVLLLLRWDDSWQAADCDLDLLLFENRRDSSGNYMIVDADVRIQDGGDGDTPLAAVGFLGPATADEAGIYFVAIQKNVCPNPPAWMQLLAWDPLDHIQYQSPSHHMGNPEESRSAGMLAVGAAHYWNTNTIAAYSSRGPTIDGRTKPDITGVACGTTATDELLSVDGNQCWFPGTSQAAPHVAGMAALVKQRFPDYSPAEVVRYLEQNAVDRGAAGDDNTWGHGMATLPVVQASAPGLAPAAPPTGNIEVRDGINPGEVVVSWNAVDEATYYRIGYVNMVTDYELAKASNTGEWLEAFIYVDVNALNFTEQGGRVEYTVRRLAPGVRHAFTVLTSNDVENTREHFGGRYSWPSSPRWSFHTTAP